MRDLTKEYLIAVGDSWRNDWTDFDGRTLQEQIRYALDIEAGRVSDAKARQRIWEELHFNG